MATYLIDNGQRYSDHVVYFVEAPEDFGDWLEKTLIPWLRERDLVGGHMRILAVSLGSMSWRDKDRCMSWERFLNDRFDDFDFDVNPPEHRPRYQGV